MNITPAFDPGWVYLSMLFSCKLFNICVRLCSSQKQVEQRNQIQREMKTTLADSLIRERRRLRSLVKIWQQKLSLHSPILIIIHLLCVTLSVSALSHPCLDFRPLLLSVNCCVRNWNLELPKSLKLQAGSFSYYSPKLLIKWELGFRVSEFLNRYPEIFFFFFSNVTFICK